ncbi:hypothetical protein M501DRAFT_943977 [Patellaria atrata CBS 101060]|uniref:S-adenosyl-L-methionine-dependent methyltransferase n=1 Tax=Patellaria atrata CBS 101060 TaxID=1346257 RepID=A0A9P4VKJ0_9PEZI|nr:hypothetical protein M501DRAFT_943977 [Patellaria atrata CBS 101060]
MSLPRLTETPARYAGCCLALSSPLIRSLSALLPANPEFSISVGSGSGLLEALLMQYGEEKCIHGIDVFSCNNKYLPEENFYHVTGTREMWSRAGEAAVWLFVYPRDPYLIEMYLDLSGDGSVETIIWAGPKVDWPVFQPEFLKSPFEPIEHPSIGLANEEMIVVLRKKNL